MPAVTSHRLVLEGNRVPSEIPGPKLIMSLTLSRCFLLLLLLLLLHGLASGRAHRLCHDVARGILPFANADKPVAAGILPDADDAGLQPTAVSATADDPQATPDDAGADHEDDGTTWSESRSDEDEADGEDEESDDDGEFTRL